MFVLRKTMHKEEIAKWLVSRVKELNSFPSYDEAIVIVRELEELEEFWYGWLLERKRAELVADVYLLSNR